jgi:hypothetical protein
MTTAFSGLQTKLSLYNVWENHQSPSDLSFCLLTSCPRVKPCKRESTALHSPKPIQAIRLQSLLEDPNKAVYVNKRDAKRLHNRSTNEKKNNNNRDSATNAAISLMGIKENSNGPKNSFKKRNRVSKAPRWRGVFSGKIVIGFLTRQAMRRKMKTQRRKRRAHAKKTSSRREGSAFTEMHGTQLNRQRRVSIGNKVIYITETGITLWVAGQFTKKWENFGN